VTICSNGVQPNLICIFRHYILFSMIFRSSRHFLGIFLNQKKKRKQLPTLGWDSGPRPQCGGTAARSLPGPRPKRRGPLGPTRDRNDVAWLTR
jgi:hypothetical protein